MFYSAGSNWKKLIKSAFAQSLAKILIAAIVHRIYLNIQQPPGDNQTYIKGCERKAANIFKVGSHKSWLDANDLTIIEVEKKLVQI